MKIMIGLTISFFFGFWWAYEVWKINRDIYWNADKSLLFFLARSTI